MRELRVYEAIAEALAEEMRRDEAVFLMGEDVGLFGGTFRATEGLMAEFGSRRVRDTPSPKPASSAWLLARPSPACVPCPS